jgi:hypothetical protein
MSFDKMSLNIDNGGGVFGLDGDEVKLGAFGLTADELQRGSVVQVPPLEDGPKPPGSFQAQRINQAYVLSLRKAAVDPELADQAVIIFNQLMTDINVDGVAQLPGSTFIVKTGKLFPGRTLGQIYFSPGGQSWLEYWFKRAPNEKASAFTSNILKFVRALMKHGYEVNGLEREKKPKKEKKEKKPKKVESSEEDDETEEERPKKRKKKSKSKKGKKDESETEDDGSKMNEE